MHKGQHIHVHATDGRTVEGTVLYVHDSGDVTVELLRRRCRATPPVRVTPLTVTDGFPIACPACSSPSQGVHT